MSVTEPWAQNDRPSTWSNEVYMLYRTQTTMTGSMWVPTSLPCCFTSSVFSFPTTRNASRQSIYVCVHCVSLWDNNETHARAHTCVPTHGWQRCGRATRSTSSTGPRSPRLFAHGQGSISDSSLSARFNLDFTLANRTLRAYKEIHTQLPVAIFDLTFKTQAYWFGASMLAFFGGSSSSRFANITCRHRS